MSTEVKIRFLTFSSNQTPPGINMLQLKAGSSPSAGPGCLLPAFGEGSALATSASKQSSIFCLYSLFPYLEQSGTYLSIASRQERMLKVLNRASLPANKGKGAQKKFRICLNFSFHVNDNYSEEQHLKLEVRPLTV